MFERRANGNVYVSSPKSLEPYPVSITECLLHWAATAPERVFLGQRNSAGVWRTLTYSQTLEQVRSVAQSLLDRDLNERRPVMIVGANSIEHALLALACLYAGVPYAPVSPKYALEREEPLSLRVLVHNLEPAMIFADDGLAIDHVLDRGMELIRIQPKPGETATPFGNLFWASGTRELEEANSRTTGDTVAKILFTSGSTGSPRGVITTQRMLCSNQQMIRSAIPFLAEEPPVLCDWLPWNHVFGGSHNFGIALYNGGSLYIDSGRPTAAEFQTTLTNLREIAPTVYLNVPKGYEMLVGELRADASLRRAFFSRLKVLFCAAAVLRQSVWEELRLLSKVALGREVLMMSALGATESAPMALATGCDGVSWREVGLPVPGVELKLVPVETKFEARLRGPNVTPGFWRDLATTSSAFDEEGFFRLGDTLEFVDAADPMKGFLFAGRLAPDFKLSSGTWVNADALRSKLLARLEGFVLDVVITAPDRDYVGALVFLRRASDADRVRSRCFDLLKGVETEGHGASSRVRRFLLLDDAPSTKAGELTEKGTINQNAVLRNREDLIDEIYAGSARVIGSEQTRLWT